MFGWLEFILIAAAVLVLFGGKKLPGLARGIGRAVTNFKAGLSSETSKDGPEDSEEPELPPRKVGDAIIESRKDKD